MIKSSFWLCLYLSTYLICTSSMQGQDLPFFDREQIICQQDWLIDPVDSRAQLYQKGEDQLVFSNGLVSRSFVIRPNGATIGLDLLTRNESFLRSVRPEAEVTIDGVKLTVGGLTGQPIHNYLLTKWIDRMQADPSSLRLIRYTIGETRERFPWKARNEWMSRDITWPAPGMELVFYYQLDDTAVSLLTAGLPENENAPGPEDYHYLKDIIVSVHYELFNGIPVFSKWIEVQNNTGRDVKVNSFKSEILALVEGENTVDFKKNWELPNITVETDYNFGGMTNESVMRSSISWSIDPLYTTQVNYERHTQCLLEAYPKYGPDQVIEDGGRFVSYHTWELPHDSRDKERKGLEYRRMMRAMAPWAMENPILMHVRNADDESVIKAIDQCAGVGFEMVIMTFWSGFNAEDSSQGNIERIKKLADYAHSRGIALGGYSLLASRSIDRANDVVMPEGMIPCFGNSPCLGSDWGLNYFEKLNRFYELTGLDVLEHDGSYPGDVCTSDKHPGHHGLSDSQWSQYRIITDFYKWCRARGIYLNVPDYYFLSGSSKIAMGYRETNWSLPREQQEIIERQNIYDGTWTKTPSMGWMFVPLVEYQGGGKEATIEPLSEHLPHYGQRLVNLFGAGVQACYRGPQLYDTPETMELVKRWVTFYKKHRRILDSDIIHIRRADGRDYDAIMHVDPTGDEKGFLMIYNPLDEPIKRSIRVNLYYTGLKKKAMISEKDGKWKNITIDRDYNAVFETIIPARSQTWFVIKK